MKKLVLLCFLVLWGVCWGEGYQQERFSFRWIDVTFTFPQGFPETIYDNEVKYVPMHVHLEASRVLNPDFGFSMGDAPVRIIDNSGRCPVSGAMVHLGFGDCDLALVITGHGISNIMHGYFFYLTSSSQSIPIMSPPFSTTVVRRPLSMQVIEPQDATVGKDFSYPVSRAINNYNESVNSGAPVFLMLGEGETSTLNNLGLYFDARDFTIKGTPNKAGTFLFHVGASNVESQTELVEMTINVQYNEKNKPRFKPNNTISSATPHETYQLNLMDLLEGTPGFNTTNQVTFKIDDNSKVKSGLALSAENNLVLEGKTNPALAGDMALFTVVATSNTGGDSEPYQLRIPVAYDRSKKPSIEPFKLEQSVGEQFSVDLSQYLHDPAQDSSLAVKIDQIEPQLETTDDAKAFRVQILPQNPKILEGYIPENAVGKTYYITLHANTRSGGDSEKIRVPLHVSIDETLTPRFRQDNPQLPLVLPGQPFAHDFVANRDVWPEYDTMPYEISFAEGYVPPQWLKLEHNKLFSASDVPFLEERRIKVVLVIKNIPGGASNPITLFLTVP